MGPLLYECLVFYWCISRSNFNKFCCTLSNAGVNVKMKFTKSENYGSCEGFNRFNVVASVDPFCADKSGCATPSDTLD